MSLIEHSPKNSVGQNCSCNTKLGKDPYNLEKRSNQHQGINLNEPGLTGPHPTAVGIVSKP